MLQYVCDFPPRTFILAVYPHCHTLHFHCYRPLPLHHCCKSIRRPSGRTLPGTAGVCRWGAPAPEATLGSIRAFASRMRFWGQLSVHWRVKSLCWHRWLAGSDCLLQVAHAWEPMICPRTLIVPWYIQAHADTESPSKLCPYISVQPLSKRTWLLPPACSAL